MKIMMIPGERNEEQILKVREATATYYDDDREDFEYDEYRDVMDNLIDEYGLEAMFDAQYYACENGAKMLQDQTDYFTERLYEDEIGYYFHRMTGVEGYL